MNALFLRNKYIVVKVFLMEYVDGYHADSFDIVEI